MRSPRILARPWRPLCNPRPLGAPRAPTPRASSTAAAASASWGRRTGIPERPPRRPRPAVPQEGASWAGERAGAAIPPRPGILPRTEDPAPVEEAPATTATSWEALYGASQGDGPVPEDYSREEPEVRWDRNTALAVLEFRGPEFVVSRFETLAARQCRAGGSAGTLAVALREMKALGLKPTPAFYGSALAALTIHPDYLLRSTILDHMRRDWIELTPDHRIHAALGLLRDGQYEMALDEVDDMHATDVPVPPYLHEILIYAFANLGFLDEAMALLHRRTTQDPPPRDDLLYFLLDACAAAYHHPTTARLWRLAAGKVTPSDGTLLNVMNTAARHADPELALEALRRLTDRRVQMSFHHFEPVVEAHAGAGDVEGAFRMLCVMDSAGVRPGRGATRCLFSILRDQPEFVPSCVGMLERLRGDYKVPIAAVNVLLETLVYMDDVPSAEALLAKTPDITPDPPTLTTYLPFLTTPSPLPEICATAISLFPDNTGLPAPDLARLAGYIAPHSLDAALAYLRCVDAEHEGEEDAWEVYSDAVRAIALEMVRREDDRAWEFLPELGRRNPAVAREVRELGSAGALE